MRVTNPIYALLVSICLIGPVSAQQGNPEEGKIIAYTCNGCHGIPFQQNVYPTYSVPKIGGQNYGYIVAALQAYRDGSRKHRTMNAQAHTLSDEEMHHVAAYFVSLSAEAGGSTGGEQNSGDNP